MASRSKGSADQTCGSSAAFLLSQLGAHAARRFGERVATIGLTAPEAGLIGQIAAAPGISQQALAEHVGLMPSRIVALIDALESRSLVERRASEEDRRSYALHLSEQGRRKIAELMRIGAEHEQSLCAALNRSEQSQLAELCKRIADEQGLTPGVHPGFKQL